MTRKIERSNLFKKDFKRVSKGKYSTSIDALLIETLQRLISDQELPYQYRDHALIGNWRGFRDCHIKPDLILIYRKVGDDLLQLARLGSHSELSL